MKELSRLTEGFTESVIREMTRMSDAVGGYNLSQGFPDFDSPEPIKDAAIAAIREGMNQYPVTFGEPELREAISRKVRQHNRISCDPETDITVTCGATEAMLSTLKAITNPSDEIIVFEPFYENYGPDGILSGATPRYVELHPPDWSFSHQDLAHAFNPHTKAIVVNTPHNPTGKVFSRDELEEIASLCQEWDVYAVTDEVYEHILYDSAEHVSIASIPGMEDRTVTINSVSKSYSVTGWRVGWAIAHERITRRIRKVHDFLTVGAPTPFQHAAAVALSFPSEYYVGLQQRYARARQYLLGILQEVGFRAYVPRGAYYIIADTGELPRRLGAADDFSFSQRLIETTKVATVPGSSFYSSAAKGKEQVRFCFCKTMETLEAVRLALRSLAQVGGG